MKDHSLLGILPAWGGCSGSIASHTIPSARSSAVARSRSAEPVPTVGKRLKCSGCGSREIDTRPQLHPKPLDVLGAKYRSAANLNKLTRS